MIYYGSLIICTKGSALPATLEDPLGFVIVDVARLLRRRFEKALENAGLGLTVAEARTLAFVSRRPGLRQSTLADELCVEPMTLVGLIFLAISIPSAIALRYLENRIAKSDRLSA